MGSLFVPLIFNQIMVIVGIFQQRNVVNAYSLLSFPQLTRFKYLSSIGSLRFLLSMNTLTNPTLCLIEFFMLLFPQTCCYVFKLNHLSFSSLHFTRNSPPHLTLNWVWMYLILFLSPFLPYLLPHTCNIQLKTTLLIICTTCPQPPSLCFTFETKH
jgi:hypothetical protein